MKKGVPIIVYVQLLIILIIEQVTGRSGRFASR